MVFVEGFITSLFLHRMLISLQSNDEATPPIDILKQPLVNKESIKMALREDRLRLVVLKDNSSLRDSMTVYPYLQHPDMVRKSKSTIT